VETVDGVTTVTAVVVIASAPGLGASPRLGGASLYPRAAPERKARTTNAGKSPCMSDCDQSVSLHQHTHSGKCMHQHQWGYPGRQHHREQRQISWHFHLHEANHRELRRRSCAVPATKPTRSAFAVTPSSLLRSPV
jgi:hypothetical protein